MVHIQSTTQDGTDSDHGAAASFSSSSPAVGASSRKAAQAALRSSLESDRSYDDGDYDGDEEARLFAGHDTPHQEAAGTTSKRHSTQGPILYDAADEQDGNEQVGHAHTPSGHESDVHRFEDRRETGGWTTRLKGRGPVARAWEIAREALPTLVLSVFSLMFAGELLVHIARWPVFVKVDKLFILVPILLNLKGNLEMNLSLRMSTSANIGELDVRRTRQTLILGNMSLLQVQALIVSSFAGILAFVLGVITPEAAPEGNNGGPASSKQMLALRFAQKVLRSGGTKRAALEDRLSPRRIIHHHPKPVVDPALRLRNGYFEFVLVIATGMLSASLSSAILGSFMCALVVVTRQLGGNPDNIASPLAASLGDLLTLTILGLLASLLVHFEGTILATLILVGLLVACGSCFVATYRNAYVRELLSSGWVPLIVAMFISSGAGLLLDAFVQRFEGFALLAPVVTGLPGACAAIFVSRTSTALHSGKGAAANMMSPRRLAPVRSWSTSSSGEMSVSSRNGISRLWSRVTSAIASLPPPTEGWLVPTTLFIIGLIIETLFLVFVWASGQMSFGLPFAIFFVIIGAFGFVAALFVSHALTIGLWYNDYDPDIYSLPFVSSIVDVVGQALLVTTFTVALALGDSVTAAVNAGEGHGGA
ncbi:hypothetical protein IE81DRAFT_323464 [Ceraceosorus guamensis]|uniref:SLC41A/MgtE integral membrane domain-containing protein n=1 Tax=Ceraceosorus guamensis TaxID=1522189 RepID=A0A316VXZ3_9BASI|nr:hypothetical protein IE81DRAFT_323464 [Ceraceosorus guamensis]PWN42496.1 hypothetical protein IE81DRAFT_323464 [Ceraceosorus guamensis]